MDEPNENEKQDEEENAVFVRADINKYDDPTKKRWQSVQKK